MDSRNDWLHLAPDPTSAEEAGLVQGFLRAATASRPDAAAVSDIDGSWTYADLSGHARGCSEWLRRRGVRPGDRVTVEAGPEKGFLAMAYGTFMAGAVLVPIAPNLSERERAHIVRDAEPALFVTRDLVSSARDRAESDQGPTAGKTDPAGTAHPAMLLYTSGSTSYPKAVVCPHPQVAFAIRAIASRLRYRCDDVVFNRLPLSFDYGLYQIFLSAEAAAELVLARPADDVRLIGEISRTGATVVPLIPTLAEMLIRLAERSPHDNVVRLITNTGERLDEAKTTALRRCFPGAGIQLMYGLTECKRVSIAEPDGDFQRPGSVGQPLDGTTVRILGDSGKPLQPLEVGQITVSGPNLMAGYWRSPELTAQVYRSGPDGEMVLHTGDWGHLDAEGNLYVEGRRDQLYKSQGVRTSAAEIEAAAASIPEVRMAAVLPPRSGSDAVLCVVTELAPEIVLQHLHQCLEALKVPRSCRVFASLPMSTNGKVDRTALADWVDE